MDNSCSDLTAFYADDMVILHQDLVCNLPKSLAELTEFEDVLSIYKFITDVMHASMGLKRPIIDQ